MNTILKEKLIALLRRNEHSLCRALKRRLGKSDLWECIWIGDGLSGPVCTLTTELAEVLEGKPLFAMQRADTLRAMQEIEHGNLWSMGLARGVDLFLTGEEAVRDWVLEHVTLDEHERLELFTWMNRAFYTLFLHHSLQYCQTCRCSLLQPRVTGQDEHTKTQPRRLVDRS